MRNFVDKTYLKLLTGMALMCVACATSKDQSKRLKVGDSGLYKSTTSQRKVASVQEKSNPSAHSQISENQTPPSSLDNSLSAQQSVTVTIAQVAKDLKLSQSELRTQSIALNDYLIYGRLPNKSICPKGLESSAALCRFLKSHREKIEVKNNTELSDSEATNSERNVPIRPDHFNLQQNMHYVRLMRSLSREPTERVLAWVPRMLEKRNCPRNLSAASIRKLENMLPDKRVELAIEKLYEHSAVCLRPNDAGYHPTHFRQALLRELWGNKKGAQVAITRAALGQNLGMEAPRTLFWAGKLQDSASLRNQYWKKLVGEHPLSYHSLEVWRELKVDPSEIFLKRPIRTLVRNESSHSVQLHDSLRWLEALYLIDKQDSAQRLANWLMERFGEDMSESTLMYVSALKSSQNTPLNAIVFLTRRANENPQFLNEQTLRMLFPRPFLEVFHDNSARIDPFLLMSIARQESGFNPRARSSANAVGLLQLLPSTARQMAGKTVKNLYDENTNVALGVKYLEGLVKKFDSVELALAGYNAGPSRVPTWKRRYPTTNTTLLVDLIPFKETRNYVSLIVRNNYWYEKLYRNDLNKISTLARNNQRPQGRQPASSSEPKMRSALVSRLVETNFQSTNSETL